MVTGGGQGLGRAIAEALATAGCAVAILDVDADRAASASREIGATTGAATCAVCADVAVKAQVDAAIDQVCEALGEIDVLINNAGIWRHNTLLDVDEAEWGRVFAVNVTGALFCVQRVAPAMKRRRSGKIIQVASIAGVNAGVGWAAYQTSKAAMIMMSQILAAELADHGVQVNVVCPGAIRTAMLEQIVATEGGDVAQAADAGKIAEMILGLIAPFEQTTTGQVVDRDGQGIS